MNLDHTVINCFDLEMCCWEEGRTGEIISIGVVTLDLITQQATARGHFYVKPEHDEISDFCTSLTGITPEIVRKQGRPLAAVLNTLRQRFGGSKKAYACWGRDDAVLEAECLAKGLESPVQTCLNVATLYMLKKRYGGRRLGMQRAMAMENLTFTGTAHNALTDSENMLRLIVEAKLL